MSELGDVLELLHTAGDRIRTLTGTLLDWFDEERAGRAFEAFRARSRDGGTALVSYGRSGRPPPARQIERRTLVHYQAPDRYRLLQQASPEGHQPHDLLHVCDGERVWTYLAAEREAWVQAATSDAELLHLVDPSWLPAACVLSVSGHPACESRPAVEVYGRLRTAREPYDPYYPLVHHAEEIVAVMDAETGLLLSTISRFEGVAFRVVRFTEVTVDQPLDEELFRFTPPPGIRVRDLLAEGAPRPPLTARVRFRLYGLRHRFGRGRPRP